LPGFCGAIARLEYAAVPAHRNADLAVCECVDVSRGVDHANVRTDCQQCLFNERQVLKGLAVWILAEIGEHREADVARCVDHSDTAVLELRCYCGIEHQAPTVKRCIGHDRPHLALVVSNPGGAPHVANRVLIARIVMCEVFEDLRVEVFPVWQLGAIELLERASLDLAVEEPRGRHDDVIACVARHQLGLEQFV